MFRLNGKQSISVDQISDFINFLGAGNVMKASFQRNIDKSRVKRICTYLKNEHKDNNYIHCMGVITFAFYKKNYYCIDGQHRLEAYKQFYKENSIDFNIYVEYFDITEISDLKQLYRVLNQNVQVPSYLLYGNENIGISVDNISNKIIEEFGAFFYKNNKKKIKATRPKLYRDEFGLNLKKYIEDNNLENKGEDFAYNKLIYINNKFNEYNNDEFHKKYSLFYEGKKLKDGMLSESVSKHYKNKIKDISKEYECEPFYFGLFNNGGWLNIDIDENGDLK